MKSTRNKRKAESEFAERLAVHYESMTVNCVERMNRAYAEAIAAIYKMVGTGGRGAVFQRFEEIFHAGIQEAIQMLPALPISRREFDELPVVEERDDLGGRRRLCRRQVRACWIIIDANHSTAVFYRPEIVDGAVPLH